MATIRYGSSVGPARTTGIAQRLRDEDDEAKAVDDADPNVVMQCPYDKNHQIRACRFPFHIVKCAKNHPKLANEHKTCPFNAKHLVPTHQLAHHIEHCKDKPLTTTEDENSVKMNPKFHVPSMWTAPACEEDWDEEVDENATTFVWGVTNNLLSVNQPEQPVTNNLKAGIRAPRTLPGKFFSFARPMISRGRFVALTFPLFRCLSVALSAPNTTSVLSTVSLLDSSDHQE